MGKLVKHSQPDIEIIKFTAAMEFYVKGTVILDSGWLLGSSMAFASVW